MDNVIYDLCAGKLAHRSYKWENFNEKNQMAICNDGICDSWCSLYSFHIMKKMSLKKIMRKIKREKQKKKIRQIPMILQRDIVFNREA